jgi:hypothetical protein
MEINFSSGFYDKEEQGKFVKCTSLVLISKAISWEQLSAYSFSEGRCLSKVQLNMYFKFADC